MRWICLLGVVASLAFASAANAQSSLDAYGGPAVVGEIVAEPPTNPPERDDEITSTPAGSLPFTGFDVALVALGGMALLASGVALRRMAHRGT